jgi:3-deoxy-7-phosphoheptulonate synthase
MNRKTLIDTHIAGHYRLPTPRQLQSLLPASKASLETVAAGRRAIVDILNGKDGRLILVVGPCSIHDPKAALEYAERLSALSRKVAGRFFIAMRVYFEKPRTAVGWKGLINDPYMNDSFRIESGLKLARRLLLDITAMGLATATEALDPITPQYLSELVCWHAIGARTVESQTHREMASGLSSPVGFKNATDGNVQAAVDAMRSALRPHHFLGIDLDGNIAVYKTRGNADSHLVLRGGKTPNYGRDSVRASEKALAKAGLPRRIMVDCSHGNSNKEPGRQPAVFKACLAQIKRGDSCLIGMMVESQLHGGNQPIPAGLKDARQLKYGVSVTDKCLGWEETERLILGGVRL